MKKRNFTNVEDAIKNLKKGSFVRVSMLTTPTMNKRNNPYYGRVKKLTIISGASLGVDYAKLMQNAAKRSGNETEEKYDVDKRYSKGVWVNGLEKFVSVTNTGQKYLHIYMYQRTSKRNVCYMLDGKIITQNNPLFEQIAMWDKNYNKKPQACAKQAEYGVDDTEIPMVITPLLENIIGIKQNDINYFLGF